VIRIDRRTSALVLGMALDGCSRSGPAPTAARDAGAAATTTTSPEAASIDPTTVAGAFRGTLDGKHTIVMHLVNRAGTLEGTYYYVPSIEDLQLHGTVSSAGVVHLDEASKGHPTGAFDGQLAASGALDGTWSNPDRTRSLPVHLEPVRSAPGAPVTIVERKKKAKLKPTRPFDRTMWSQQAVCDVDIAYPDLLGAVTPAAQELAVDRQLQKSAVEDLEACEAPFQLQESYKVVTNGSGVLSLEQAVNQFAFGAAHPNYSVVTTNYALPSGRTIALGEVITPAGLELCRTRLVASLQPDVGAEVKGMVDEAFSAGSPDFSLGKDGLRVSVFDSLPHAYQGAGADGTAISVTDLAAVRKRPGPADALWGR
jgi:hypothetical protein